jgi:uncharacterized protein YcnI
MKVVPVMLAAAAALVAAGSAFAHARLSPPVALAEATQVFTLIVPNEKEDADTTEVEITIPKGFSVGAVVPNSDWSVNVHKTGSGEDAVVEKIAWTGGEVGPGEAAFLQFSGRSAGAETYAFPVKQTYSNGEVANWTGPESADDPAPTVEATSSIGGGGTSTLSIVALVVGTLGVILGGIALAVSGGRRPLA